MKIFYFSPTVEVIEFAIESGIAQSGGVTPGAPGEVIYEEGEDNYDF